MNVIFSILVVLIVIASILLTIAVLLQNGKGDSLASNFVAGNQTFGVRQTANMLEKITWGLVAFILVVAVVSSFTLGTRGTQVDITDKIRCCNFTTQSEMTQEFTARFCKNWSPMFPVRKNMPSL